MDDGTSRMVGIFCISIPTCSCTGCESKCGSTLNEDISEIALVVLGVQKVHMFLL